MPFTTVPGISLGERIQDYSNTYTGKDNKEGILPFYVYNSKVGNCMEELMDG